MAKARGFGRKSTTEVDPAPTPAAAANQKARRTPRSRPASRPEGAATEKAARPTPASKRRSRVRAASPMRCTVSIRNPAMHMFVLSAVGTISALAASRPWRAGVRFAADSALEGRGFEPSVPPKKRGHSEARHVPSCPCILTCEASSIKPAGSRKFAPGHEELFRPRRLNDRSPSS